MVHLCQHSSNLLGAMAASKPQTSSHDDARDEFANFLKREDIVRFNYEDKEFYHPEDIKNWMLDVPENRAPSNSARLLYKVYCDNLGLDFQPIHDKQIHGHLLVFAILMHPDLDCGHMIHMFKKHIHDANLDVPDLSGTYRHIIADLVREGISLPKRFQDEGFEAVIRKFDRLRWAFSPALLDLNMDQAFPQGSCILPFCYSKRINEKGGTASVQMYGIQEDLVVSKPLRDALHSSLKRDPKFGPVRCYAAGAWTFTCPLLHCLPMRMDVTLIY